MIELSRLVQGLIDGLAVGSSYAVLALTFCVLWATVRTVNLALIQIVAVGGYGAYFGGVLGGFPVAVLFGVLAGGVMGLISHYVGVKPTLHRGQIYPMIATLGVGMLMLASMSLLFGDAPRSMPNLLPTGGISVHEVYVSWNTLTVLLFVLVILIGALVLMKYTSIGLAFRSSAWSPELAGAYGVNLARVRFTSAFAAGGLAGLSGVFIAVLGGSVSPILGSAVGLKGVVAMLIGGAGNLLGAVIGGLAVGLAESSTSLWVAAPLNQAVSFGLLLLIMIVRPSGLTKEY